MSGDVFKFIEDYWGVSFMDAVQIVADRAGISLGMERASADRPEHVFVSHQALYEAAHENEPRLAAA